MKCLFILFCLFVTTALFSQDLKGTWKGMVYSSAPGDSTPIELKIKVNKKEVMSGTTTWRFGAFNFATAVLLIKQDSVSNSVYLRERTIVDKDVWDYTTLTLNEYNLKFEGPGRLTGSVYCFRTLPPKVGMEGGCHAAMQLYLVKQ
jgi:hypothetical protein